MIEETDQYRFRGIAIDGLNKFQSLYLWSFGTELKLRQWDMMELHAILEHRKKVGYNTPTFIKWVNTSAEENVKIFFINEIRLYNETESAPILAKQLNARSVEIRGDLEYGLNRLIV